MLRLTFLHEFETSLYRGHFFILLIMSAKSSKKDKKGIHLFKYVAVVDGEDVFSTSEKKKTFDYFLSHPGQEDGAKIEYRYIDEVLDTWDESEIKAYCKKHRRNKHIQRNLFD